MCAVVFRAAAHTFDEILNNARTQVRTLRHSLQARAGLTCILDGNASRMLANVWITNGG